MTIQNLADAKKVIEEEREKYKTRGMHDAFYRAALSFSLQQIEQAETEILRRVDAKIEDLETALTNSPQEYWSEYENRLKDVREIRVMVAGENK